MIPSKPIDNHASSRYHRDGSSTVHELLRVEDPRWPATKPVTARPSRVCWSGTSSKPQSKVDQGIQRNRSSDTRGGSFFVVFSVTASVTSNFQPKLSNSFCHHPSVTNIVRCIQAFCQLFQCKSLRFAAGCLDYSYLLLTFPSMSFICFTTLSGAVIVT